jgi:ATP-dependent protease ClpP protease subunit
MEHKQNKQLNNGYNEYEHFPVSYEPIKCGTFHIYLFGEIISPQQFISPIEVMRAASENDQVMIHLQSCGGSLDATDTFLQAMHECQARVIVRASGGVHSAGTLILLAADSFTLSDNFSSLIHNGSTGTGGKFSDYRSETAFTSKWMERVLRNAYEGFLEPHEIDDVIKGVDMWLDGDEWIERHERRNEYIQQKMEELGCECGECNIPDDNTLAALQKMAESIEQEEDVFQGLEEAYNEPRPTADKKPRKKK